MQETASLNFALRLGDGTQTELTVDSAVVLVGSAGHCEIRLPAEDAAPEQLKITLRGSEVVAEARCLDPPATVDGQPLTCTRLGPNRVVLIGRIELMVRVVDTHSGRSRPAGGTRPSVGVYVFAVIGLAVSATLYLSTPPAGGLPPAVAQPSLWADHREEVCRQVQSQAACASAFKERSLGDALRERAPFHPEDGVSAVGAFRRAAACFRAGGRTDEAEQAIAAAESLQQRIERDFHVHHVRLERAIATAQYQHARTEVRILMSFLGKRGGEYGAWLGSLDRQIEQRFSGKKGS